MAEQLLPELWRLLPFRAELWREGGGQGVCALQGGLELGQLSTQLIDTGARLAKSLTENSIYFNFASTWDVEQSISLQ